MVYEDLSVLYIIFTPMHGFQQCVHSLQHAYIYIHTNTYTYIPTYIYVCVYVHVLSLKTSESLQTKPPLVQFLNT